MFFLLTRTVKKRFAMTFSLGESLIFGRIKRFNQLCLLFEEQKDPKNTVLEMSSVTLSRSKVDCFFCFEM